MYNYADGDTVKTAAIFGASGYGGGELVRILDDHPGIDVAYLGAHSQAGKSLGDVHPQLAGGERLLAEHTTDLAGIDVAFLALPHGASSELGYALASAGVRVVDLGSDFRLDTPERYLRAYRAPHPLPEQLAQWSYGLPELFPVAGTTRVASPGCYPTAATLALAPLLAAGAITPTGIVVNAVTGVSGAGRALKDQYLFGAVNEGVSAYGIGTHRHRPEMEMALERYCGIDKVSLTFTPHLVPMHRGIHATSTVMVTDGVTEADLRGLLVEFADGKPFYDVAASPPQSRWVVGSNRIIVSVHLDAQTGQAIVLSVIDNLIKGAAGQAIQAANIMLGFEETLGLPTAGWMP